MTEKGTFGVTRRCDFLRTKLLKKCAFFLFSFSCLANARLKDALTNLHFYFLSPAGVSSARTPVKKERRRTLVAHSSQLTDSILRRRRLPISFFLSVLFEVVTLTGPTNRLAQKSACLFKKKEGKPGQEIFSFSFRDRVVWKKSLFFLEEIIFASVSSPREGEAGTDCFLSSPEVRLLFSLSSIFLKK